MANLELKTASGGSATIKPLDRVTNEEFNLPAVGGTLLTEENLHPSMTGSIALNGTTNNTVVMTDIVTELGLEAGDVIRIDTGTYNKLHTVESITDNSSIIVNYEHAGNRGNVSLKLPDTTDQATVMRIAKWFNAPIGLGQGWVTVTSSRAADTTYTNTTGRPIAVSILVVGSGATGSAMSLVVEGDAAIYSSPAYAATSSCSLNNVIVPAGATYRLDRGGLTSITSIRFWTELR